MLRLAKGVLQIWQEEVGRKWQLGLILQVQALRAQGCQRQYGPHGRGLRELPRPWDVLPSCKLNKISGFIFWRVSRNSSTKIILSLSTKSWMRLFFLAPLSTAPSSTRTLCCPVVPRYSKVLMSVSRRCFRRETMSSVQSKTLSCPKAPKRRKSSAKLPKISCSATLCGSVVQYLAHKTTSPRSARPGKCIKNTDLPSVDTMPSSSDKPGKRWRDNPNE